MATRQDWLGQGLVVLAAEGAPALTIDRLCAAMRLSKGSFYHHFSGARDFRAALLEHFETEWTTRFIEEVEADQGASAADKLAKLATVVLADKETLDLEVAVRAWAAQDETAYDVQARVDRTRTAYLESLCRQAGRSRAEAKQLARMLYLLLVGAGHVVPPIPPRELRKLYDVAVPLVTAGSAGAG
jgi:AcrR family transcriptional regulator